MEKLQEKLYICKLVFKSVLMHNALIIYSNINLTTYFRTRHLNENIDFQHIYL